MTTTRVKAPVAEGNRIVTLDVLRGFAVLGILVMNVQSFSMPGAAYLNPTAYGDLTGINRWVWILSHYFVELKFMSIFSILFGAGILLFASRIDEKGGRPGPLHYRRTFWLLVIGMVHAYLFWSGDILVTYALCALTAYLYRNMKPKKLLILGIIIMGVSSILYLFTSFSMNYMQPEQMEGMMRTWNPGSEFIQQEIAAFRGGFADQMTARVPAAIAMQTMVFFIFQGWRAGGLMLVGMALFKWDVLSGKKSSGFYVKGLIPCLLTGSALVIFGIHQHFAHGWSLEYSMFAGSQFNYWGSLFMAYAFICGVILIYRKNLLEWLTARWAAAGRMAFSNYLGQTVICTLIFYGTGLGLFGRVERWQQILIVFAIWAVQLIVSPLWLRYFYFGPAEWLWRSLTYWKVQPLVRKK